MSDLLMLLAEGKSFSRPKLTALLELNDEQLVQQIEELQQRGIRLDMENGQVCLIPQLQTFKQRLFEPRAGTLSCTG